MSGELWIFLLVLAVNALVVLVYWIWNRFRKVERKGGYLLRCGVMLLCPVVGICFFFFGWLYFRLFFREPVDLDDVIFSKARVKTHLKADEDAERNFVPLEEAIAVTDKDSTRALMMQVVRRDISDSLTTISMALRSEDSEVSHYAASVLQETLGTFRLNIQKLYQRVGELEEEIRSHDQEEGPLRTAAGRRANGILTEEEKAEAARLEQENGGGPDPREQGSDPVRAENRPEVYAELYREEDIRERTLREAWEQGQIAQLGHPEERVAGLEEKLSEEVEKARELLDTLYRVLRQKVFSPLEQQSYTDMMEEMARLLDTRDVLQPYELEAVSLQQMDVENYEACRKWCARAGELYPQSLMTYTCLLKLYYTTGDREAFLRTMDALKASKITLDHETLEMVRVFL